MTNKEAKQALAKILLENNATPTDGIKVLVQLIADSGDTASDADSTAFGILEFNEMYDQPTLTVNWPAIGTAIGLKATEQAGTPVPAPQEATLGENMDIYSNYIFFGGTI